jgi:hypothetical protein
VTSISEAANAPQKFGPLTVQDPSLSDAPSAEIPAAPTYQVSTMFPSADAPRGLFGRMVDAGLIDPSNPDQPPVGGLLGLIQQSMGNGIGGSAH